MQDSIFPGDEPVPGSAGAFSSLVALGRHRAHVSADDVAFVFLKDGETPQGELSYAALDARARAIGAWLQARGARGERAVLLYPSGLEFVAAFMGCLYAGALAVPVYTPQARDEHWQRLDALAADAGARFLLTASEMRGSVTERIAAAPYLSGLEQCVTDQVADADAALWRDPGVVADDIAFLQYTSGSTGSPKGVTVTHGNLLHNQMLMHTAFGNDRGSVFVSWLPLFHDMGLIGNVLHTLYLGARCYLMAPVAFLQQPIRWLRAISTYRGTSSFAPNFAYDLCARRIAPEQLADLDLSSWTFALNGAEPVRADTLRRFSEVFGVCGFSPSAHYPGYGLAEGTLFASGGERGQGALSAEFDAAALEAHRAEPVAAGQGLTLVASGRVWCDQRIAIVDPADGRLCADGAIGEILLHSPSVARGYWNKPEASAETFGARIAGEPGEWLRTGDLGFLREGHLFVTGRLKELIIVRGRNLYPQDVEATVQEAWEGFRKGGGAAFSVDVDGEERLVVVQEVERTFLRRLDPSAVEAMVRRAIAEVHEVQLHDLVLIRPATLAKTSSGKIQRRRSQREYLDGTLDSLHRGRTQTAAATPAASPPAGLGAAAEAILPLLRAAAADVLRIDPAQVPYDAPLVGLGMDSLALVEFAYAVERAHGVPLGLQTLFDGASLIAVATTVAAHAADASVDTGSASMHDGASAPLSANQQSLWFLRTLQPDSHAYNVWLPLRLRFAADEDRLRRATLRLVERHPVLRCRFFDAGDGPMQQVHPVSPRAFARHDHADAAACDAAVRASALAAIDLDGAVPFRVELHRCGSDAVLLLVAHHLCVDLTSMLRLARELAALEADPDAVAPATAAGFFDHIEAERRYLADRAAADRDYWRETLGRALPVLDLPRRAARPKLQSFAGESVEFRLSAEEGAAVAAHARAAGATPFSVLLAAYALLLHRYCRQDEVLIGVPVLGRGGSAWADSVGYFVNTVAVSSRLDAGDGASPLDFAAHHARLRRTLSAALAHAALPFSHVVECVQPQRDGGIPPLTQTLFNLHKSHDAPELARLIQAQSQAPLRLGGWDVAPVHLPPQSSQLDLSLSLVELADGSYDARIDYCTALYDRALIERLAASFRRLLTAALAQPHEGLRRLPLLDAAERARIAEAWNETERDWGAFESVDAMFAARARSAPDAPALVYEGRTTTYAELDAQSDAIAAALAARGAGPETVVGVSMRRSDRLVAALLGTMKAGAAYLPLDPGLPAARIEVMRSMAEPVAIVCDDDRSGSAPATSIAFSDLLRQGAGCAPPRRAHAPAQAAYIIYTSGSTGQPKGVVNTHEGLANRLLWMQRQFALQPGQRAMLKTAYTFDVSVWEFFWPLMVGATIVVARHEGHRDAGYIRDLIREQRVGLLHFVPSMLKAFLDEPGLETLEGLRHIVCSGEELTVDLQDRCFARMPWARIANLYGPTEAAIDVSCWECRADAGALRVPIGLPIDNLRLYVLDEELEPVPVGVAGELYIGGIGLARGYIARPDLTADRFVPAPGDGRPGERLYRTGDLACHREDGAIDFLGRLDHQVKLRGFRIELGEIDSQARRCPGVTEALTMLGRRPNGDAYLLTYVAAAPGGDRAALSAALRRHLAAALPAYMVPEAIVALDAFPLNASGKVDRKALPQPQAPSAGHAGDDEAGPVGATAQRLQGYLRELLGLDSVPVRGHFFDLGGHSLLATRLCSRIRDGFGVEIGVADVLLHPVLSDLAALIDARRGPATADGAADAGAGSDLDADGDAGADASADVRGLSAAQRRMWFIEQLEGASAAYTMPLTVRLDGVRDTAALVDAVTAILRAHPELRCRYIAGADGDPVREWLPADAIAIAVHDLSALVPGERDAALERHLQDLSGTVFALEQGPMCRADLVVCGEGSHVLTLLAHHIAADGASLSLLMRQIAAALGGAAAPVATEDYAAHCRRQARMQREGRWRPQLAFWTSQLAGMPPLLELPTDFARPPIAGRDGAVVRRRFDAATAAAVERMAAGAGATAFMAYVAAYQTLLARYSGADDVFVGTAVSTRGRVDEDAVVGLFVNTLVLRTEVAQDDSFVAHLQRVRETCLAAYANADVPFDDVVDAVSPARSMSHAPLVQAMITVQPDVLEDCRWPAGVRAQWRPQHTGTAKFDLNLLITAGQDGLLLELEYRRDLFLPESAAAMLAQFARLLEAAAAEPRTALVALPMQSPEEAAALVADALRGHRVLPPGGCLHDRFAEMAGRRADAVAVSCGGEALSYAALEDRANRLAHHLRALGVGPEVRVGLCMERSVGMIVGLLAILKAGGAYVPLDPNYPADRLQYMAADAGLRHVLGDAAHAPVFADGAVEYLDCDRIDLAGRPGTAPVSGASPDNAAYVIYTSGSTGRPKGVVVTHANVGRLFAAADREFAFGAGDVWSLFHSYAFDFSVWEIWGALLYGGRLAVVPYLVSRSPEEFVDFVEREGVTVLNQTPTAFLQFVAAERQRAPMTPMPLRYVVFGGEKLNIQALAPWFERYPQSPLLVNMYGITETTVHVTFRALSAADARGHASAIGAGLADLRLYVLDAAMRPQAPGVPGELFVAGAGLARGYLGRPELSADRFPPDPFSAVPGARMYRTGDLVRRAPDGDIHYIGRIDQQVKIRGFRIELGEIEAACTDLEGIAQAVVRVGPRDTLVAYVVAEPGAVVRPDAIQTQLRARLPDYMVPSLWVPLPAIPLTGNGKIDVRRLPEPAPQAGESAQGDGRAPRDPVEQMVLQSWSSLLERELGDVDANFFAVGGNSLLATRAVAQAQRLFGVRLGVRDLFDGPTPAAFAACVRARLAGRVSAAPALSPAPEAATHPVTHAQERLWFLDRLDPGNTAYTMPGAFRVRGALDPERFAQALSAVVARHEALRTRFLLDEGLVRQAVMPAAPLTVPLHDLSTLPVDARATAVSELIAANAAHVFDLAAGGPLRCGLVRVEAEEWVLLLNIHHIVFDGVSLSIFARELADAYAGERPAVPELQFKDYAHWLHGDGRDELERQVDHWVERLRGAPPVLELPTARPRPAQQSFRGEVLHATLPAAAVARLREVCRERECTPYVLLMACYGLLLSRYSGQRDLVVGTPVANRGLAQTESLIGFFANTLPLRLRIDPAGTVGELIEAVRGQLIGALAQQEVPFGRLVEALQPERATSHSPVFQVMFVMQGGDEQALSLPGLEVEELAVAERPAKYDLTLSANERDGGIGLCLEYAADLFDAAAMRRFCAHYLRLLDAMLADDAGRLDRLDMLGDEAAARLSAAAACDLDIPPPGEETLHGRVFGQCVRSPDAPALVAVDAHLTYAELHARVERRARALRALGVRPGDLVGVCLPRNAELVVSLLATQCVGAAYVPLDPHYPPARLRGILDDADPRLCIVDAGTAALLADAVDAARLLRVDAGGDAAGEGDVGALPAVPAEAPAYLIYTSGSTGRPKGVVIRHRNAIALLDWARHTVDGDDLAGVFASTSVCFDLSVYELFLPLCVGGTVLLAESALELHAIAARARVTLINTVPSAIDAVTRLGPVPESVRVINLAGEPLTRPLVDRLHAQSPQARVYNLYGPSEDTTYSTGALMPRGVADKPSIGHPIANTRAYVLDEAMRLQPTGVPGELYLGGEGVALGYLGRPDLTAEKFVPDPFSARPGARLYRTGDTVRESEDGALEFIGRADHQVKIRGFRIELGEIEHHLGMSPLVAHGAVVVIERDDDRELVACVAAREGVAADTAALRAALEAQLPRHMVPTRFEWLQALPLTPNGKVDRKALVAAVATASAEHGDGADHGELRGETEHALAELWLQLLPLQRVGGATHFFDHGGHSLLAVRLIAKIAERFGVALPMRKVFDHPTLSALAECIETQRWLGTAAAPAENETDDLVDEGVL